MLRDLSDAWGWLQRILRRLDRIESGAMLENSSITNGRLRLIGGLLRLDSGARLEGVGTFQWSGAGSIAGNWEVLQGGVIKVGGVLISPVGGGRIMVGEGPVGILLDGGTGTLTMGNVRLEGGKIYVGVGGSQIVVDGATGKITAGNVSVETNKVTIGGADGDTALQDSRMTFSNGSAVRADSAGVQIAQGNAQAAAFAGLARLRAGTRTLSVSDTGGYSMSSLPTKTAASTGLPAGVLHADSSGSIFRIV